MAIPGKKHDSELMDTLLTNPTRLRKVVIIGFCVLYALSLVTPVANDGGGSADYRIGVMLGFLALAFGWIPPSTVPWSANILVLIGWVFFCAERRSPCGLASRLQLRGLQLRGCRTRALESS